MIIYWEQKQNKLITFSNKRYNITQNYDIKLNIYKYINLLYKYKILIIYYIIYHFLLKMSY